MVNRSGRLNAEFVADSFGKSFGSNHVLKSATVWAPPGQITVLFGRNGCGKSTLIRCALGLTRPDRGVVRFGGMTVPQPKLWKLARAGLFYLPDRGSLSIRRTFADHLSYVAEQFGNDDTHAAAKRLGVGDLLDAYPDEMSGGERRRAELSVALARRPSCLIADEPLAEIEPKDRLLIGTTLRELAQAGTAVLITGHEVHDLLELADQIIWMTAGTTHGLGSANEARVHDQFRREYLGGHI